MNQRTKSGRVLNCRPHRRHFVTSHRLMKVNVPDTVDPRDIDTPIFDQGDQGSCTMNMGCGMYDFQAKQKGLLTRVPTSREFGYWVERLFNGDVGQDAGSDLPTCGQVWQTTGVCTEGFDKYGDSDLYTQPSSAAFRNALRNKVSNPVMLNQDMDTVCSYLAAGNPVGIGMSVYESFESVGSDGIMPYPQSNEELMGGHALAIIGYQMINGMLYFITRNSWGTSWGAAGYVMIPQTVVLNPNLVDSLIIFEI